MRIQELEAAVYFLRRLTVGRIDEERLILTVEALEQEIQRRRQKRETRD